MTAMTAPTKPAQPVDLTDLINEHNACIAAANGAIRGTIAQGFGHLTNHPDFAPAVRTYLDEANEWKTLIAEWYTTPAGVTYRQQVDAWNTYVIEERNRRVDARQARINARAASTVRAAACPNCFATHPGEC